MKYATILLCNIFIFLSTFSSPQLHAQSCYTIHKSQSGMSAMYNSDLDSMACSVISAIDTSNFKVIGFDLYPVYAYVNPADGYEKSYDDLYAEVDAAHSSFILISKELFENNEIRYQVKIKWGTATAFDDLTEVEKATIENMLNTKAGTEYERLGKLLTLNSSVEIEVLKQFLSYVIDGVDVSYFEGAGFDRTTLAIDQIYERTDEFIDETHGQFRIINTMGIKVDGIPLHEHLGTTEVKSYMTHLNTTIYITSKDYISDQSNFNQVTSDFENDNSKIKIWFHFNFQVQPESAVNGGSSRFTEDKEIMVKSDNNLDATETEQMLDDLFNDFKNQWTADTTISNNAQCGFGPQWGKKCLFFKGSDFFSFLGSASAVTDANMAFICGFIDGFLGMCNFVYSGFNSLREKSLWDYLGDIKDWIVSTFTYENMKSFFKNLGPNAKKFIDSVIDSANNLWSFIQDGLEYIKQLLSDFWNKLKTVVGAGFYRAVANSFAYFIGVMAFDGLVDILTFGVLRALKGAKIFHKVSSYFNKAPSGKKAASDIKNEITVENAAHAPKMLGCGILRQGCFVKNTPVLVANKNYSNPYKVNFGNTAKAMAVAASMPIVAVPIQDVQLLDYAVAHETVNATYGMTASASDDIYMGLMDKDPYTSDQQRERDEYQLDNENWNEVVFEEVHGGSTAKLALHHDWIEKQSYEIDAVVNLDVPEQGISGPFRITSIKHIIPQKKPLDDDETDEYDYRPVTALFTHESNQVFNISFENGEELGVTYQHPIYSTTAGDWKLAGELEIGEEVLTKSGKTKVVSSTKKGGSETVYNLEVKELHNFLVGESGLVVHNACARAIFGDAYDDLLRDIKSAGLTHKEALEELEKLAKAAEDKAIDLGQTVKKGLAKEIRDAAKEFASLMADQLLNELGANASNVVEEVSFEVELNDGSTYGIRPDAVANDLDADGIHIGEAKYSSKEDKDWEKDYRRSMTDNQRKFHDDYKAGKIKHLHPKGNPTKLQRVGLSKGTPISPSEVKSYRIFGSKPNKTLKWLKKLF